jgi:hypothetical protein
VAEQSVAVVGSSLAAFCSYATLRHGGLEPAQIAVFGPTADPAATWRGRAAAIHQRRMRSESEGHCAPTSFPGLAVRSARRGRTLAPIVDSLLDRYQPTVDEFLDHLAELRERCGWDDSLHRTRVQRIRAVPGGFEIDSRGSFAHVLVATGHPGLARPEQFAGDPAAVHAYEPHDYAGTVAVVGAGLAAATEWGNALDSGANVTSVRRREPLRRPLNVPRPLFSRRGLARFHAAPAAQRLVMLDQVLAPSYPPDRLLDDRLARAAEEGRFRVAGEVIGAEQVICATGFLRGFRHDPLLRRLVDEHELATAGRLIALAADSTVAELTDQRRTLSLAGVPGQWAFPAADTLMGAKYAARRFLQRVLRCRTR